MTRDLARVLRDVGRTLKLVWTTRAGAMLALALLTVISGVVPNIAAYVGKLIIDAIVTVTQNGSGSHTAVYVLVGVEAALMILLSASQRASQLLALVLQLALGHEVSLRILRRSVRLSLTQIEDPDVNDLLGRARSEAKSRPAVLIQRLLGLGRLLVLVVGQCYLLLRFSPWAVLALLGSGLPAFLTELHFSETLYKKRHARAEERRRMSYLENVLTWDKFLPEIRLLALGGEFLRRYRESFEASFAEDRRALRNRGIWGVVLLALGTGAFYGAYVWVVRATLDGQLSLGEMTMYLVIFRQGQASITSTLTTISGLYEDSLYLANLFDFLDLPEDAPTGSHRVGLSRERGLAANRVSYTYPDQPLPAVRDLSLAIAPGEKVALVGANGSGKSTLIRLLTGLLRPTSGTITLDGRPLQEWDEATVRRRIGIIFQDFNRYKLTLGENIGAGNVDQSGNREAWQAALDRTGFSNMLDDMPLGFDTVLGRKFSGSQELSGGQWQKVALARAFMQSQADIVLLDEPTSALDAESEARVFERLRNARGGQSLILVTHRLSTARLADRIVLLDRGQILEEGSHEDLLARRGKYAELFDLQKGGYE